MRKTVLSILLSLLSVVALAQYTAAGYYRVHNKATSRYVYVYDNTGSINISTASADMGAIELYKDTARMHHDPASVMYIHVVSQSGSSTYYDVESQGTGIYAIIGYYVNVYQKADGSYQLYAEGKYLDDNETSGRDLGFLGTERTGDYRCWYINMLDNDANYFGVLPTVQIGNKYYKPFYAAFPFTIQSSGMKVYYIKNTYSNAAIWEEATGEIPAATPVYIECSSPNHWDNKISIQPATGSATWPAQNKLSGVYFCNHNRRKSHDARTAYNPVTMRVLSATADGHLCFAKSSSLTYLPGNESYLTVPSTAEDTLRVMTEAEYVQYSKASSISLSASSLTLLQDEQQTISASILPTTVSVKAPVWSCSDTSVVRLSANGSQLTIRALKVGTATITATTADGTNLSAQCNVTVNPVLATGLSLSKGLVSAYPGDTVRLTANLVPVNTTNRTLSWESSNPAVATVADGLVTVIGVGAATITASTTDGSNLTASCSVIGNAIKATSITLTSRLSENDSLSVGDTLSLSALVLPANATNKSVRWSTSNSSVIGVSNNGLCTARSVGQATITATTQDGSKLSATYVLNVRPILAESVSLSQDTVHMSVGDNLQFSCTVLPSNTTNKSVNWTSSDESVFTVSASGLVHAATAGYAVLTVQTTDGSARTDQCVVLVADTVIPPTLAQSISLSAEQMTLVVGDSGSLVANVLPLETTDKSVEWTCSDTTVLAIVADGANLSIRSLQVGQAVISASTLDGTSLVAQCQVTVNPRLVEQLSLSLTEAQLLIGDSLQLDATVLPLDATNPSLAWSCSDTSVLAFEATGTHLMAHCLRAGSAVLTASTTDGSNLTAQCSVVVTPRLAEQLSLSLGEAVLTIGDSLLLGALVLPLNTTNPAVLWESSNPTVLAVEADGAQARIYAVGVGNAVVTVSTADGSMLTSQCSVTVLPVYVSSIVLNVVDTIRLYENESTQLTATVLPENATIPQLSWESADEQVMTVSQDGRLTALQAGNTMLVVRATDGSGVYVECPVEVLFFTDLLQQLASDPASCAIYDIQGRRLYNIQSSGLYVINGKLMYIIR